MKGRESSIEIYVPRIITDKDEAVRYIYDWYNWPDWSNWGRRAGERKSPYILCKKYNI